MPESRVVLLESGSAASGLPASKVTGPASVASGPPLASRTEPVSGRIPPSAAGSSGSQSRLRRHLPLLQAEAPIEATSATRATTRVLVIGASSLADSVDRAEVGGISGENL